MNECLKKAKNVLDKLNNPMPESKKLSELIESLSWKIFSIREWYNEDYIDRSENLGKNLKREIYDLKNQIDQKFEELKCECKKEERLEECCLAEKGNNVRWNLDEENLEIICGHGTKIYFSFPEILCRRSRKE